MIYILIILWSGAYEAAATNIEFNTKEACYYAREIVLSENRKTSSRGGKHELIRSKKLIITCVPKGAEK